MGSRFTAQKETVLWNELHVVAIRDCICDRTGIKIKRNVVREGSALHRCRLQIEGILQLVGGYSVGSRTESQSRDDSEIGGSRPFRPIRIQRKTSKSRLSGISLIMCERPRSDHSRAQYLAVMGLGSGSVTLRRPQFRQAKTVIAKPASRSTARSGNIAPRHLSQVYIHSL